MNMKKCEHTSKCDFYGCNNLADYSFYKKGLFGASEMHLCLNCMTKLHEEISKVIVPKHVPNPLKKPKIIKE